MEHLWNNHLEAQDFARRESDPAIRAVLRGLHNLLLESAGVLSELYLRPRIVPEAPLDVLRFYKLVAQVFSHRIAPSLESGAAVGSARIVGMDPAIRFAEKCASVRCKSILMKFLDLASAEQITAEEYFDVSYCCRLIAAVVPNEEVLDFIVSGAAEREANEFLQNPDKWFG